LYFVYGYRDKKVVGVFVRFFVRRWCFITTFLGAGRLKLLVYYFINILLNLGIF
jgi:hypothetical protein